MKVVLILFVIFFSGCFVNGTYTFKYSATYEEHHISHKCRILKEEILETPIKIKVYKDSVVINNVLYDVYWRKEWMNDVEEIGLGGEQKIVLFRNPDKYNIGLFYKSKTQYIRLTQRLEDI